MIYWGSNRSGRFTRQSVAVLATTTVLLLATMLIHPPAPGYARYQPSPGKGKFLVASRHLRDPNFSETVVLLIGYSRDGALGLVINRPTDVKLFTLFPDIEALQQRADKFYIGGPVARNQLMLLIRSASQPEDSDPVFEDVYVSSNPTLLQWILDEGRGRFRVYAGYAGWAPGQLDAEISRGDWHILPADAETIFDKEPTEIWPELIRLISGQWVRLNHDTNNEPKASITELPCQSLGRKPRLLCHVFPQELSSPF